MNPENVIAMLIESYPKPIQFISSHLYLFHSILIVSSQLHLKSPTSCFRESTTFNIRFNIEKVFILSTDRYVSFDSQNTR
jgi:hypothetical protein